jgi:hypothetical protein
MSCALLGYVYSLETIVLFHRDLAHKEYGAGYPRTAYYFCCFKVLPMNPCYLYATGTTYSLLPSVLNKTTTALLSFGKYPLLCSFLKAANGAAPHGPALTPWSCKYWTLWCASKSLTITEA